jgi:two-component system chemotaxis response regulator CheY
MRVQEKQLMAVRVLIADTSRTTRDIIRQHLECGGCQVVAETENVAQTLDLFRTTQPHVVTLDAGLRGAADLDALALFRLIRRESPTTSVVMVGGTRSTIYQRQFLREGALESIVEPFDGLGFERMWSRLSAIYPELRRGN